MKRFSVALSISAFALAAVLMPGASVAQQVGGSASGAAIPTGAKNTAGAVPVSPATDSAPFPVTTSTAGATGGLLPFTVGTSSVPLFSAAGTPRRILFFKNQSLTATVAVCPGSVTTPGLNTAGCVDLPPGGFWSPCSATFCPSDAFNAVASAAATPFTGQSN